MNQENTDLIRQAKGDPGQAPVPTPTLETNKHESGKDASSVLPKPYYTR